MVEQNDWRLLNDVEPLKGQYLNPNFYNAPHLKHCIICLDYINDDRHQYWYIPIDLSCCICENCYKDFNDMLMWKLLDGWDIDWEKQQDV